MRHDIKPNERAFSTKEVAEELNIATPTVRKYGQVLERNGYEFFKDGHRRIFVRSDIEALIALRDTDNPFDDTAKDLANQQKARLEGFSETQVAIPDTYDNSFHDPHQLKDFLMFISQELAASREMNVQLTNNVSELQSTVARLRQDHHAISSGVGNSTQKMNTKLEKLMEQQKTQYENLLQQEKEKNEFLHSEIQNMRDEQKQEWRSQNEFNKRLEESVKKPKGNWGWLFSIFRK
ncbi:helix-turn-helix domain-containing protein [Halobacillus shinanisalinarum]|uniref:Helix-turn-helix domain-containing protein n=1 Tax=Halobacillus shinanisalinarum TaxID=2932258 RepID=A0ABY4H307_9BACI|nr:helix-turn-helix domain-containing protein [Halobacillus shinanisalinarum]UOQ94841.1 helix-turn-helix domain-containing protein [Halobacillus shinanisalinarum]